MSLCFWLPLVLLRIGEEVSFLLNFCEFLPLYGSSFLTRAFHVQWKPLQLRYRDRFLSSVFDTFCNAKETLNTFLGWYILFIVMIFCVFLSVALSLSSFCLNIPALYLTKDTSTAWKMSRYGFFSCIRTEYGDLLHKSLYLVWILENADQKKLHIWTHFTHCCFFIMCA